MDFVDPSGHNPFEKVGDWASQFGDSLLHRSKLASTIDYIFGSHDDSARADFLERARSWDADEISDSVSTALGEIADKAVTLVSTVGGLASSGATGAAGRMGTAVAPAWGKARELARITEEIAEGEWVDAAKRTITTYASDARNLLKSVPSWKGVDPRLRPSGYSCPSGGAVGKLRGNR